MGRKLRLDADTLAVISFETAAVDNVRGTVQGQEAYLAASKITCRQDASNCCQSANTCTTQLC